MIRPFGERDLEEIFRRGCWVFTMVICEGWGSQGSERCMYEVATLHWSEFRSGRERMKGESTSDHEYYDKKGR